MWNKIEDKKPENYQEVITLHLENMSVAKGEPAEWQPEYGTHVWIEEGSEIGSYYNPELTNEQNVIEMLHGRNPITRAKVSGFYAYGGDKFQDYYGPINHAFTHWMEFPAWPDDIANPETIARAEELEKLKNEQAQKRLDARSKSE